MLVNPNSFKVSSEKICNDGNWTRNGPVIEHWGEGQDKIAGSGKIAGFYALDMQNANSPGLTRTARNWSMAYQNFMSLFMLYRNNGGLYLNNATSGSKDNHTLLSVVGSIYIYYDGVLYIGSFDSFNLSEADTSPHTHDYDFAFTVRAWFVLDEENTDAAGNNYGLKSIPSQSKEQLDATSAAAGEARRAAAVNARAAFLASPAGQNMIEADRQAMTPDEFASNYPNIPHIPTHSRDGK